MCQGERGWGIDKSIDDLNYGNVSRTGNTRHAKIPEREIKFLAWENHGGREWKGRIRKERIRKEQGAGRRARAQTCEGRE